MLMPGKATASSRPNLRVLATSAVFNFAVGAALLLFVCMQEEWFVMKMYMISLRINFSGLAELESQQVTLIKSGMVCVSV